MTFSLSFLHWKIFFLEIKNQANPTKKKFKGHLVKEKRGAYSIEEFDLGSNKINCSYDNQSHMQLMMPKKLFSISPVKEIKIFQLECVYLFCLISFFSSILDLLISTNIILIEYSAYKKMFFISLLILNVTSSHQRIKRYELVWGPVLFIASRVNKPTQFVKIIL